MKTHRWFTPYLLAAPAVIWVLVFSVWPFVNTLVLSFTNARPLRAPEFVGWANYARMFGNDQFLNAIVTSVVYMLICVPFLTILPLLLALLVSKKLPGIGFFRTTFYFPVLASVVVVAIIWGWLFESQGVISQAARMLGLVDGPTDWMVQRWPVIAIAASLTIWKGLGYYMVVYLAALGSVDKELYEAAALDGAGAFKRFLHITIPGVRGAMLLIMALIVAAALRVFSELHVLTNGTGGPGGYAQSLVMLIKTTGQGFQGRLGMASAMSVALFILTIGPLLLVGWLNMGDSIKQFFGSRRKKKVIA